MSGGLRRRIVVFLVLFIAALAATLPLRVAASWSGIGDLGFTAREAEGTIWSGSFVEARIGGTRLGDVDAGLKPLPLLLGRAELRLGGAGEGGFRGSVSAGAGGFSVRNVEAELPAASVVSPLPISGASLEDVSVAFQRGRCTEAQGTVRVRSATGPLSLPPTLSGAVRCERDRLLVPLTSQSGMEQLQLRIGAAGQYEADLIIRPSDRAVAEALAMAGFSPTPAGYRLRTRGRLH